MSHADRCKWNERWKERGLPGEPSPFLRSLGDVVPTAGTALDVAGGAGRHTLWLLQRGLRVTLVDISDEALAIACARAAPLSPRLTTAALDLDHQPLPTGPFNVIVVFHFLDRRIYAELAARLTPGGVAIVVHMTTENLRRHASPGARYLLEPGELPRLVPGLEVLHFDEGWHDDDRHEARLVARRAAPLRVTEFA